MMKKLFIIIFLLICAASLCFAFGVTDAKKAVIARKNVAGVSCGSSPPYSDDFSTDTISCYAQESGTWSVSGGYLNVPGDNATRILRYTGGATSTVTQYAKVQLTDTDHAGLKNGVMLRANGASGYRYLVRYDETNTRFEWAVYNGTAWNQTVETSAVAGGLTDGDAFGVTVQGTGNSTIVSIWVNPTANLPNDVDNWDGGSDTADNILTNDPTNPADVGKNFGFGGFHGGTIYKMDNAYFGDTS